jgi:inner membrane protein involved in colicin E2 resistance
MTNRFLNLYLEILLEHWRVQVFVYLALLWAIVFSLLSSNNEIKLSVSVIIAASCVLSLKALSAVILLMKTYWIIKKCNDGSNYFLDVYREWTGRYF